VIAESYERIHRSNLVGMGVLPLQYPAGESAASLGLDGREVLHVRGLSDGVTPGMTVEVEATRHDGSTVVFPATVRIDGAAEVDYHAAGGVLNLVLRQMLGG
jgi:aconitate hydratase